MRFSNSELTVEQGRQVFLSADYHLFPKMEPIALKQWSKRLKKGDLCIFLGDLYESWVENRHRGRPGYEALHAITRDMVQRGIDVHLVVGNRDFLAGNSCTQASLMKIHHGPLLLTSAKCHLALFHGDELLPEDKGYLRYKRMVRHSVVQMALKSLPLSWLMNMAEGTRERSKAKLKALPMDRFTPSLQLIEDQMVAWGTQLAVAGHLHKNLWVEGRSETGLGCQVLSSSSSKEIAYRIWMDGKLGEEIKFPQ